MAKSTTGFSVWKHFEKFNTVDKTATCNSCRALLSYKTTITNLKSHFKKRHASLYNDLYNSCKTPESSTFHTIKQDIEAFSVDDIGDRSSESRHTNQEHETGNQECVIETEKSVGRDHTSSDKFKDEFDTAEPPQKIRKVMHVYISKDRKIIDLCLLKMIVYDLQPFSIVDDIGFREYTEALNPNYKIPDKRTLSGNLLSTMYEAKLENLKTYVQTKAVSVCVTCDCWTSRSMDSYMALTAHFITNDTTELKSVFIQCVEIDSDHTGINIYQEIKNILQDWEIYNKVNFFVTDKSSNMESAVKYFETDGWSYYECLAYKLNLVVHHALDQIQDILSKVRKVVNYFKKSTVAKENLLKYQTNYQNITQPKTLIKSMPSSWNSVYLMLNRFIELKDALTAITPNLEADLPMIFVEEWKCIQQMCVVLKPFYEATNEITAERYLVASKAIAITSSLISICEHYIKLKDLHLTVKKLTQTLEEGMKKQFGNLEMNLKISLSTVLDPRFKLKPLKNEDNIKIVKSTIITKIMNQMDVQQSQDIKVPVHSSSGTDPLQVDSECNLPTLTLWSEFDSETSNSFVPKTSATKAAEELEQYLADTLIKRSECPLKWWKEHRLIYPAIFRLFIQHFNIMVTSIPCERMFSKSGILINDRKTRLTTKKVSQMMFLNFNKL